MRLWILHPSLSSPPYLSALQLLRSASSTSTSDSSSELASDSSLSATEALQSIISELSHPISPKSQITDRIKLPWKAKVTHLSEIVRALELFPLMTVSQRPQLFSKLWWQLSHLDQVPSCTLDELCRGISGLKAIPPNHPNLLGVVSLLKDHLCALLVVAPLARDDVNSVGIALSGLRSLPADAPEVHHLRDTLATALETALQSSPQGPTDLVMDIDIACRALSGLENSTSREPVVRTLAKLLGDQLREPFRTGRSLQLIGSSSPLASPAPVSASFDSSSKDCLTGSQIQLAACGLRGLSSEHFECRAVVGSLAGRLQTMRGDKGVLVSPLTASAAVTLLSNLRHMDPSQAVCQSPLPRLTHSLSLPLSPSLPPSLRL
jgi:hypothetical protein